jgi:hypothetical protein
LGRKETYPSKWEAELEEQVGKNSTTDQDTSTLADQSERNYSTRLEPLVEPKYTARMENEEGMKFRGMDLDLLKARM